MKTKTIFALLITANIVVAVVPGCDADDSHYPKKGPDSSAPLDSVATYHSPK
ncbi:MAG: hypothetical protein ACJ77K_00450 [Bacteroidia bacterium]